MYDVDLSNLLYTVALVVCLCIKVEVVRLHNFHITYIQYMCVFELTVCVLVLKCPWLGLVRGKH